MFSQRNMRTNHRTPGTYTFSYTYVIEFMKMTSNSKHRAVRKHKNHRETKQ